MKGERAQSRGPGGVRVREAEVAETRSSEWGEAGGQGEAACNGSNGVSDGNRGQSGSVEAREKLSDVLSEWGDT